MLIFQSPDNLINKITIRITYLIKGNEINMANSEDGPIGGNDEHRNYTTVEELTIAISKGLSLQNRSMSPEEAFEAAEHLINFFGYNDRVIDNMLEPEDRDAFYTMEDIGILQTEREETTLYDGREWRIHYWILNVHRIIELSRMKSVAPKVVKNQDFQIYDEIPDEYWKMN